MLPALTLLFACGVGLFVAVWAHACGIGRGAATAAAVAAWAAAAFAAHPAIRYALDQPQRGVAARTDEVERQLTSRPDWQAFRLHAPESYRRMVTGLVSAPAYRSIEIGSPAWKRIARREVQSELRLTNRLRRASDQAIVYYANAMLDELRRLRDAGGETCFRYLHGSDPDFDAERHFDADLIEEDALAVAAVVESAAAEHREAPEAMAASRALEPAIAHLNEEFGPAWAAINDPYAKDFDHAKLCAITIRFLEHAQRLPPADRALGLRYWLRPHA